MTREQPVVSNARWWRHDSCRCTLSVSTRRPASVALARLSIYIIADIRYISCCVTRPRRRRRPRVWRYVRAAAGAGRHGWAAVPHPAQSRFVTF